MELRRSLVIRSFPQSCANPTNKQTHANAVPKVCCADVKRSFAPTAPPPRFTFQPTSLPRPDSNPVQSQTPPPGPISGWPLSRATSRAYQFDGPGSPSTGPIPSSTPVRHPPRRTSHSGISPYTESRTSNSFFSSSSSSSNTTGRRAGVVGAGTHPTSSSSSSSSSKTTGRR